MSSRIICIIIFSTMALFGCRKEEPNPEILDPVYQDLAKELAGLKSAKDEAEKAVEAAQKAVNKAPTRTMERRESEDDLHKAEGNLARLTQVVAFYELRVERRRVEARRDYKIAFAAEKPWPDPKEFEAYVINKRLSRASKNWADRVPKFSTGGSPNGKEGAKPAQKPAGEGEAKE